MGTAAASMTENRDSQPMSGGLLSDEAGQDPGPYASVRDEDRGGDDGQDDQSLNGQDDVGGFSMML